MKKRRTVDAHESASRAARIGMAAAWVVLLATGAVTGCAGSKLDLDARSKIQDVAVISPSVSTAGARLDVIRIDFRAPAQSPASTTTKGFAK